MDKIFDAAGCRKVAMRKKSMALNTYIAVNFDWLSQLMPEDSLTNIRAAGEDFSSVPEDIVACMDAGKTGAALFAGEGLNAKWGHYQRQVQELVSALVENGFSDVGESIFTVFI